MRIWQNSAHRDSRTPGPISLHLRWTERLNATKGRWQVTTLEPPKSATDWEHPPGLIASGDVGKLPSTGEFDISFTPPALESPGGGQPSARPARSDGVPTGRTGFPIVLLLLPPNRFYVRIVGIDVNGNPCGAPSNSVSIDWTPPAGFEGKFPSAEEVRRQAEEAAKKAAANAPVRLSLAFEPFRAAASDAHYRYVVTRDFMMWKKGQKIKLEPKSDNWLDDVGDALGDVGDFIGDSANWVSHAWNDVKAFAVDTVADRLPGCDDKCRMALAAGLEAGLAAMGVPPSIPNFDQLSQAGKGYLVQTLAEQASQTTGVPVPPEAVEAAVDRMYDAAKKHADGSGSGSWLRPDPDFMDRPAIARVNIVSQSTKEVRGFDLVVQFYRLYDVKRLPIPPIPPGGQLTIPVVLDPPSYQTWRWELEAERRRSGSHAFVNQTDVGIAWRKSHDQDKNTLSAVFTHAGKPSWQPVAMKNVSFVAAAGYSG